jgi:alcohol dehydrogenase class IV
VEALLLPSTMTFNSAVTTDRLTLVADLLDPGAAKGGTAADRAITSVREVLSAAGVPQRLRDVSVTKEALVEVAEHAMDDFSITRVPRPVDRDGLLQLLQTAW